MILPYIEYSTLYGTLQIHGFDPCSSSSYSSLFFERERPHPRHKATKRAREPP